MRIKIKSELKIKVGEKRNKKIEINLNRKIKTSPNIDEVFIITKYLTLSSSYTFGQLTNTT